MTSSNHNTHAISKINFKLIIVKSARLDSDFGCLFFRTSGAQEKYICEILRRDNIEKPFAVRMTDKQFHEFRVNYEIID